MIDSFKNFERLRYRLSNDMREIAYGTGSGANRIAEQISNTIFATVFSALITEVAFGNISSTVVKWYVLTGILIGRIVLFCVIYAVSYLLYNWIYKHIADYYYAQKVKKRKGDIKSLDQIQKDFDNIACDSILVAKDYIDEFLGLLDNENNRSLRVFYYYEIMHYLATTCKKTKVLVDNESECIRTSQKGLGVDLFRIRNMLDMINEVDDFLESKSKDICEDNPYEDSIGYQRNLIKDDIEFIEERYKKIKEKVEKSKKS